MTVKQQETIEKKTFLWKQTKNKEKKKMDKNPISSSSNCQSSIDSVVQGAAALNPADQECLNNQPSGFPFKMVTKVTEYECPICLSLIRKATELPCTHLMCHACLNYYEDDRLQTQGKYVNNLSIF